ncbi:hypothetical protein [Collimonas sp. OK607]|uniref:hypothetical protein n=1 Tax=Collimonas sp. OK607 TaxID=1798194 RepID=UPI001B8DA719|nr:hypothetical protein [Collimonas sp. OK607]
MFAQLGRRWHEREKGRNAGAIETPVGNARTTADPANLIACHAEARKDITAYVVGFCFYNTERLNSVLGNLPPTAYERKMAAKEPIVVSEIT